MNKVGYNNRGTFILTLQHFADASYFAFETKMRSMMESMLSTVYAQQQTDQTKFKELQQHNLELSERIEKLEKTVFENGAKVLIFDIINRQIKDLQDAHASFSRECRFTQDLLDSRIGEAVGKERELQEFAKVLEVKFDNMTTEVARLTQKEERDVEALGKRADDLAGWLKTDSEKLFDQMAKVNETAHECEHQVRTYSLIVGELQATEDRNDEFMKQLLAKAESLELFKVDKKAYKEDQ